MKNETEKGNEYIFKETIQNARTLIRHRNKMFEAKLNYKNKKEYIEEKFLCDSCETEIDDNSHVLYCESYKSLREGCDINCDRDLALYLQKVLNIRSKLRLSR